MTTNPSEDQKLEGVASNAIDNSPEQPMSSPASTQLTSTGKILTWLCVIFCPFGILIVSILYYRMRKKNPAKAANLNKHSWLAFLLVALPLWIFIMVSDAKNAASEEVQFAQYAQNVKNGASAGCEVTVNEPERTITFTYTTPLSGRAEDVEVAVLKKELMKMSEDPKMQQDIQIMKKLRITLVFCYKSEDNVPIDITIPPSEW